jgi:hypothetical protein
MAENPTERGRLMICRRSWLFGFISMAILGFLAPSAWAEKIEVKLTKQWTGSAKDEKLAKDAPEVITDAKTFEKLWNAWKVGDKVPEVDFTKEIVILSTTSGSKISLSASLDDKGNLSVLGAATADFGPGFRYVIATVSREGVKKVNGKELPKE